MPFLEKQFLNNSMTTWILSVVSFDCCGNTSQVAQKNYP